MKKSRSSLLAKNKAPNNSPNVIELSSDATPSCPCMRPTHNGPRSLILLDFVNDVSPAAASAYLRIIAAVYDLPDHSHRLL